MHKSDEKFVWDEGLKKVVVVMAFVAVAIAGLFFTGAWSYLADKFSGSDGSSLVTNIVFILIIIGGFLIVWFGDKPKKKSEGEK